MWYFAYGSNMAIERIHSQRKVRYTIRIRGILKGYKLLFNKTGIDDKKRRIGYANIVPFDGSSVEGILYYIDKDGLDILDYFEGYPEQYRRELVKVRTDEGKYVFAVTYIAQPDKTADELMPTREYLGYLLGGRDLLGNEYASRLEETKTID